MVGEGSLSSDDNAITMPVHLFLRVFVCVFVGFVSLVTHTQKQMETQTIRLMESIGFE